MFIVHCSHGATLIFDDLLKLQYNIVVMKKKKHNCAQDLPLHLSEHCAAKENLPLPLFKRYYPSWVLTIQHTAIPTVIIMRLTFTFNAQS